MENIKLGKELRNIDIGGGDFVNVYFGTDLKEEILKNKKILIAKVPPNALDRNAIELLKLANHRNILQFLNVFNRNNNFFIISSYQEFNLHSLIYENIHIFEPRQTAEFVLQIIEGINWFHDFLLFHSYINPKDIYLENYSTIKISGFYFSEIFESDDAVTSRPNRPLPYRCPPEEMDNLGLKYDIWCIGLVLYELCFRKSPENELATKLNSDWNKNLERLPNEFNKYFKFLFKLLLEYNFKSRKSSTELLNDPSIQLLVALRDESSLSKIGGQMGQYAVHKCIKEGSTYKVFDNMAGEYRILKLRSTRDSASDVYREIEILTQCKKDNFQYVITYFDHFVHNIDYVCIVTEYSEFGSLKDQLNECKINRVRFDPNEIYELIKQLISGIRFMHNSLGIIHRLIKPSNIIMCRTKEGKALKYCDFYFARKLLDLDFSELSYFITRVLGVSDYSAPEMVFKKNYDWLVDVWSLGCIIYEMNTLNKPFDISKFYMFDRVDGQDHVPLLSDGNPYKLLVKMMLQIEPKKRASAQYCYDYLKALNPSS